MKKKAVFLGERRHIDSVYNPGLKEQLGAIADIGPEIVEKDQLEAHREKLRSAEVVFSTWGMPALTGEQIGEWLPELKAVFYAAGSVQSFARPFLERGIAVVSAWAANAVPVAEYTAAQIILANKGFFQSTAAFASGGHEAAHRYFRGFPGNYDTKVGLIGAGMIGKKVIELLKPYRLELLVFDPFLPDEQARELNVTKTGLTEIFSQCQTISNHLANLPATVGMLNKQCFDLMLPNATFINTGRGKQVVEDDLIAALKAEPGRTALLDVTDPEPPLPSSPLLTMPNVLLTPHIAGSFNSELARMAEYVLDDYRRYLNGEDMTYNVTLKMLETMA